MFNLQLTRLEKKFDLKTYMEGYEHTKVGDNYVLDCPVCEKAQKLYVLAKDKDASTPRGTWICYYCNDDDAGGKGRTCLSLIEWLENVNFVAAARILAEGGASADADFIGNLEKLLETVDGEEEDDTEPPPTVKLPPGFVRITEKNYPAYAAERGFSVERCMRFKLGYVPDGRGYCENRLVAPAYLDGRCVGFQARYMQRKPPKVCPKKSLPCSTCGGTKEHTKVSKTKHAANAKMTKVLYNYDEARHAKHLVLIESPWAAIKLGRSAAATFGKHLSNAQIELVLQSDARELTIMWDLDRDHAAGKGGYDKALAYAQRLSNVLPVRAVKLSRDIDEMSVRELKSLIEATPVLSSNDAWSARLGRRLEAL